MLTVCPSFKSKRNNRSTLLFLHSTFLLSRAVRRRMRRAALYILTSRKDDFKIIIKIINTTIVKTSNGARSPTLAIHSMQCLRKVCHFVSPWKISEIYIYRFYITWSCSNFVYYHGKYFNRPLDPRLQPLVR